MYDVIIVGGGPAGLSAALVLGRCGRSVLVCDSGRPRNQVSDALHSFITRDGIEPAEFLRIAHQELGRHAVEFRAVVVTDAGRRAAPGPARFWAQLDSGDRIESRRLLLATGVRDQLPAIDGLPALYGRGVFHCPYCDAWERRERHLAAYGKGAAAVGLALSLRTWSKTVVACTDSVEIDARDRARAERNGIRIRTERVVRLEGAAAAPAGTATAPVPALRLIHFEHGPPEACDALFFNTGQIQRSPLAEKLGCRFKDDGGVLTSNRQCTDVPGLYAAGDADKEVQFVIVAAAEGATAAVAINRELQDEDRGETPEFARAVVANSPTA